MMSGEGYAVAAAEEVEDAYADSGAPGEFRSLKDALGCEQVAVTLIQVPPKTPRSHRNEGEEPVEVWAVSRRLEDSDSTKLEHFWEPSPQAKQQR